MFLIGLLLAIVFAGLVARWWSEGMFDTSDAVVLIVVFGGLIFGFFASEVLWQKVLAFVPLAAAGVYVAYNYTSCGTRSFIKRRCEDYMRAIEFDPRNLGARESLADALYNLGDLDRAVDELQVAVNMGAGMESQYKLGKWLKERQLRDTTNPVCKWCMTENSPGARTCTRCGSDLPYENALSRWLTGGRTSSTRYYLILIAGVALVAVSLVFLPLKYAFIPIAFCLVTLGGWSLISSARG